MGELGQWEMDHVIKEERGWSKISYL